MTTNRDLSMKANFISKRPLSPKAPVKLTAQWTAVTLAVLALSWAVAQPSPQPLVSPASPMAAQGAPAASGPVQGNGSSSSLSPAKRGQAITLDFVDAPIEDIARTIAVITGRNVVVDPRVKGNLSLRSDKAITPRTAYDQFLAALRLGGFTMVQSQGIDKIIPEADAKLQAGSVSAGPVRAGGNQIVTQIFNLNYENANNLLPVLRPLISPNNIINVNPGNNSLIITDYADNIERMAKIIAATDVSNSTDVEVVPLVHSSAADMAPLVMRLEGGSSATGGLPNQGMAASGGGNSTVVIANTRNNSLILRAPNRAQLALLKSLIAKLDQPSQQQASGNIHVVYLKNADAVRLAATLRASLAAEGALAQSATSGQSAMTAGAASAGSAQTNQAAMNNNATSPVQQAAAPNTGGQIQADPATNSLIITAPEPQFRQIRAIIDQLDTRRAQVYVESLIAEINSDKAAEFGFQWQGALGKVGDSLLSILGTNYGSAGNNILQLAGNSIPSYLNNTLDSTTAVNAASSVLSAAVAGTGGTTTTGTSSTTSSTTGSGTSTTTTSSTTVVPGTGFNWAAYPRVGGRNNVLGIFARFLETTGNGNVLSTPNLVTLDNEEAKIVIGQNVPFLTGQYTNNSSGGTGSVNPFQTVERKDVGITLRVKPQISENGTVNLRIFQEVSSVQAGSVNNASGPITNKRSIESNVLVEDGSIIVLGGLLQDEFAGNAEKVPYLGDIPLLGNLFKSEGRSRKKTNLMVFLRPIVIRDAAATEALSLDRYDYMRGAQFGTKPQFNLMIPVNKSPLLPDPPINGAPIKSPLIQQGSPEVDSTPDYRVTPNTSEREAQY